MTYTWVSMCGDGEPRRRRLGCYRAIEHIAPESLGLSVALFGQHGLGKPNKTSSGSAGSIGGPTNALYGSGHRARKRSKYLRPPAVKGKTNVSTALSSLCFGAYPVTEHYARSRLPNCSDLQDRRMRRPGAGRMFILPARPRGDRSVQITPDDMSPVELASGWIRLSACISSEELPSFLHDDLVSVGLTISIATEILHEPPTSLSSSPLPASTGKAGQLSWEVAVSFATENISLPLSPDVPVPVWNFEPAKAWKPSFWYFNIYVQEPIQTGGNNFASPELAKWIGTSGWDGKRDTFPVDIDNLPIAAQGTSGRLVRFYVQGVTDHGEVIPWDACVYVETEI
ncbi:glycoside hydrolase family protein [Salix suchowensis]|nr:glycoside hydrolase family protein [Salix suchowensis]